MNPLTSPASWPRFFSAFWCYRCGSLEGFVSRPRNLFEKYGLRLLGLRPARCADCYRRSYRPSRVPLLSHPGQFKFHAKVVPPGPSAEQPGAQKGTDGGGENLRRIA
jgi:hypothetical protein